VTRDMHRVLPHRDIKSWRPLTGPRYYTHRPCGMDLTPRQVKGENWCPFCAATINKAAMRRAAFWLNHTASPPPLER
jgi:hypothetical protein